MGKIILRIKKKKHASFDIEHPPIYGNLENILPPLPISNPIIKHILKFLIFLKLSVSSFTAYLSTYLKIKNIKTRF